MNLSHAKFADPKLIDPRSAELSRNRLVCRPDWVARRIGRWLGGFADRFSSRRLTRLRFESQRRESWFVPRITTLEPRIVLNATAELSAVSGLMIFGDLADDTVQFNLVGSGDSIQLTDASGNIIPIDGNTGGPTGSETDPLAISQINNGLVTVDLGGGDDLLQIELPDAINLTVIDGAGNDRTEVDVQPSSSPSPATTVLIASETIDLSPSGTSIQFADRDVHLIGDVLVGSPGSRVVTEIEIGSGNFEIDGTLNLGGTVRVIGDSGDIDWRDASVSASVANADLLFELDQNADANIVVGEINDAAGQLIDDLRVVSATDVTFTEDLAIDDSLTVNALDSVSFQGTVSAGDIGVGADHVTASDAIASDSGEIVFTANSQISISNASADGGSLSLTADQILIDGSSIRSSDSILIQGDVVIETDSLLVAPEIRFDSSVTVAAGRVVEIDARMIDSVGQSVLKKLGDGELVLLRDNVSNTDLAIAAGTLRVDGSLSVGANVDVHAGAVLAGSGVIGGAVTVQGGTLAPNEFVPGSRTGQLRVGSIDFESGSVFAVNVDGATTGQSLDSIAITGTPIDLSGAVLEIDLSVTLPSNTELLIVQNDSADQVSGRFLSNVDEDGNPLATPRVLEEGDRVLTRFGPGAAAVPAYITYLGGDGNDVAIVTAGDIEADAGNVTVVSRSGENLHLQTGDTLTEALLAVPTIRPIAGLNGGTLSIDAIAPQSELFIDISGFVGSGPDPLHFDADILFDTLSVGGDASVTLFDSDLSTDDSPDQFVTLFAGAQDIQLTFDHNAAVAPDYNVLMRGVTHVNLELSSQTFASQLSSGNDQLTVVANPDPAFSVLQLTTDNLSSQFRFLHPDQEFLIDGSGGDDVLQFDSFGANLDAVPTVIGGDGDDRLIWNADVTVGQANTLRDLRFDAESVAISGDIQLNSGGSVRVMANDQLSISSNVDATTGRIEIVSGATLSDLTMSTLRSDALDSSVALHGGDYRLGDVIATSGSLVLGTVGGLGEIGSVEQADGSRIVVSQITASSSGTLNLDSIQNQIDQIELIADGAVTVLDSAGDLVVSVNAGDSIEIQVANDLMVQTALSSTGATRLAAAGNLIGLPGQTDVHVMGQNVELLAGIPFPKQSITPGTVASIGTAAIPIRVAASQSFSASTSGTNGSIFIESPRGPTFPLGSGHLAIGLVDAGGGRIEIDARTIEAFSVASVNLIGAEISLNANEGIGALAPLTATGMADLQAVSATGSIQMDLIADRNITLSRMVTGGGVGDRILIQHSGDHLLSVGKVGNANGSVSILTETASIDVLQNATGDALLAGGTGHLLLQNRGGDSDITVRGSISSETGNIDLLARRNVSFTATGQLNSADGAVTIRGGDGSGLLDSTIDLQDGSQINVGLGTASLNTPGNIFVSSIRSANLGDAITIASSGGSLIDSGDQQTDLIADSGTVRIDVTGGIGSGNPLETRIDSLIATVRQSGSLEINEETALNLIDVVTFDGKIDIVAGGTITVDQVRSVNASQLDGPRHRDISLVATGSTSDILVRSLVAENVTDVNLVAGDDLIRIGANSLLIADDLRLTSFNETDDGPDAIRLTTNVSDLEASVLGTNRGDLQIDELDSILLASSDRADDTEVITTSNGEIRIHAAESIFVFDSFLIDDQSSLRSDVEIIAGGANGRIRLSADQTMVLGDSVQLKADQSTAGAVILESPQVVLGRDFQIETGDSVGVARIFAPRPDQGVVGTAFYESTSVTTSRLQQAGENDASGVLTVDVGNQGERGLTINLDWGAETQRFQQIDSLSGDAPPLQVEHVYLEQDIVTSRLNGRTSSTDPLEVRFSVRHHESILVIGQTIEQASSGVQQVAGELLSSTDNPNTAVLENGRAQFIIPALSIPVAFFPVRDVIPVFEQSSVIIRSEQTFVVLGAGLASSESVGSSITVREEYFQIRVLSADPDGEDLVPPMRLPDDVISGDKLKTLFQSLPDGRYDIQYVLGDGNIRSILSVDLRDGKPILPGDGADAGMLRLVPVDVETLPDEVNDQSDDGQPDPLDQSRVIAPEVTAPLIRIDRAENFTGDADSDSPTIGRLSVAGRLRTRGLDFDRANVPVGEFH